MAKKSILITGVNGLVGNAIYRWLVKQPDKYNVFGLDRQAERSTRVAEGEGMAVPQSHFFQSDLSSIEKLTACFKDIDSVVHMAADPNTEASWESVLHNNMEGGYHVFEAAKIAGVKRVVYASTVQVVTGYARCEEPYKSIAECHFENVPESFEPLKATQRAWPINLYAASKVFGETLAQVYSSSTDLSCLCIRIGSVNSEDEIIPKLIPVSCTQRDISRLAECCIQAPASLKFDIFFGMSRNQHAWTDMENAARKIGYEPIDEIGF